MLYDLYLRKPAILFTFFFRIFLPKYKANKSIHTNDLFQFPEPKETQNCISITGFVFFKYLRVYQAFPCHSNVNPRDLSSGHTAATALTLWDTSSQKQARLGCIAGSPWELWLWAQLADSCTSLRAAPSPSADHGCPQLWEHCSGPVWGAGWWEVPSAVPKTCTIQL